MPHKEEYRAKVERLYFDAFAKQDLAAVDDIVHPGYTFHGSLPIGPGPEGVKAYISALMGGISEFQMAIDEFIVEGDTSVTRWHVTAIHSGDIAAFNAPPTGNKLDVSAIALMHWQDGKIIEEWEMFEEVKAMTAMGLLPG
jgi:predicted ester cyclase